MPAGLPLMKNVLTSLAKSVLVPLGLTATAAATDPTVRKKIYGSGTTTLVLSNEDSNDIRKIIKSYEESGLLIDVSETVENEVKKQRIWFFGMLAATLGASLLGNMLARQGVARAGEGAIRAEERAIRAGQDF